MKEPRVERQSPSIEQLTPEECARLFGVILEPSRDGKRLPSVLLSGDRKKAELFAMPYAPGKSAFGALPYLKTRTEELALLKEELVYFSKHYKPKEPGSPPWRDARFAEGAMLFEAKTGKRLSDFCEEILDIYPPKSSETNGAELGKIIHIFGLSGAGKSTSLEAFTELLGDDVIFMDSDTVRYNLFAKYVLDAEATKNTDLKVIRNTAMHNQISGSMYLLIDYLAKELKDRGYTVIRSSTLPELSADHIIYIEHPDGIRPDTIAPDDRKVVAEKLYQRTTSRVGEFDDYDWEHAHTERDFRHMKPVTVQVPQHLHEVFLKNIAETLNNVRRIKRIANPVNENIEERLALMKNELKAVLL